VRVTNQTWDPARYARNARYVADLATPVVDLLVPRPGERILDLGCGDGALTERLVALGCDVVAVDASADQVAAARRRGLDAQVMYGERLMFEGEFDAVFSNWALHWMSPADDVIVGVWRALRCGGRFVAELGGHGCIATIVAAVYDALAKRGIDGTGLNPWYFPAREDYTGRLVARGFRVDSIAFIPRPTLLPGDIGGLLETFFECFTAAIARSERPTFLDEVREALRPKLCDANGVWTADYMLLRFAATKPALGPRRERA
jgi:SAM-dependent methyltransferase